MDIELVPLLQIERELYDVPRGMERFQRYIDLMTGGTGVLALPLTALNPMGKDHVAASLDALLALDAESIANEAIAAARDRLARVSGSLKVALVVADDAGGGWTERNLTESKHRFENDAEPKRGWATALFWTSETASHEQVRAEVLAAIYRARSIQQHGLPKSLRQMMQQEGLAARFAEMSPALDRAELASVRAIIEPHRDSTHYPAVFACLYGDDAAIAAGYPPLGLPPRAGFRLALVEARSEDGGPLGRSVMVETRRTDARQPDRERTGLRRSRVAC